MTDTPKAPLLPPKGKNRAENRADAKWRRRKHKHRDMTLVEAPALLKFDKISEVRISDELIKVEALTEGDAALVIWELYKIEVHWQTETGLVDQHGREIKSKKRRPGVRLIADGGKIG